MPRSAAQVDSALLGHALVAEAVCFAAPSEKYGETVAAAVVLSQQQGDVAAAAADIKKFAGTKLAKFKARAGSPALQELTTAALQIVLELVLHAHL